MRATVHRRRLQGFGSSCQVSVFASDSKGAELLALVQEEFKRLEAKFSAYHPESIVASINRTAGTPYFTPIDTEARSLFDFVSALWDESSHIFDPTIQILSNCYGEDGRLQASTEQLGRMLKLVGWSKVERSDSGVRLPLKGMQINLDGCVRPYVVDSLRKLLLKHQVQNAFIEMDREAATIGKQPDGSNWLLGIRHPFGSRTAITRIKLNGKCYAMQGSFEQRITYNGEIYGRALSPIDGFPIPGMLSVSVIADSCLNAFGAAGISRLRTEKSAINWLEKVGLPWMAVDRELNCHGPLAPES